MKRDLLIGLKKSYVGTVQLWYGTVHTDMELFQPVDGQIWIHDRWLQKVKNKEDTYQHFS
jgi:hypothetical protein